jgi:hypothetical protein
MVVGGQDHLGSMGIDSPLAVLSNRPRLLFDYFQSMPFNSQRRIYFKNLFNCKDNRKY